MDAQQFQQLLNQLQQAAAAQVPPAPAAPAAPAPTFALTPAQVNADQFIDCSTTDGKKLFKAATESLPCAFDVEPQNINLFCEKIQDRAVTAGWKQGNGNIMSVPDANNQQRDLITEHGRLTLDNIRAYVNTYAGNANQAQNENRRAQNDCQFYLCLSSSLAEAGNIKLIAEQDTHAINGRPSGSLFFKLSMQKAIVDARATSSHMRENLTNLDTCITTIDSDIAKFNQHVKVNREGLKARGETTDDLMINLFKGYLNAADREFVEHMKLKKNACDDGDDITADQLMSLALDKFENLRTEGKWMALSPEQEQIVALSAQFDKLKDDNLRLSKALKKSAKNKRNSGSDNSQTGGKKNKGKKKDGKWAWKKVPPKDNEPKTKTVNKQTHHWCETHLAWTVHANEDCEERKKRERENSSDNQSNSDERNNRRTSLAQAMTTILEDIEDEEDDEYSQ